MKYERTPENRIIAITDFGDVEVGRLGGILHPTATLSQEGDCWIDESSVVGENSHISGNVQIRDNCEIKNSTIGGEGVIGNCKVIDSNIKNKCLRGYTIVGGWIKCDRH